TSGQNPLSPCQSHASPRLHGVYGRLWGERWLSSRLRLLLAVSGIDHVLALLFGAISLLYATVGQAGGTAFLALMAFAAFPPAEMRPTALALNIVAATYSTWVFNWKRVIDWGKLIPLLIASMPTALIGGLIVLDEHLYKTVTGCVLLLAGTTMIFHRKRMDEP